MEYINRQTSIYPLKDGPANVEVLGAPPSPSTRGLATLDGPYEAMRLGAQLSGVMRDVCIAEKRAGVIRANKVTGFGCVDLGRGGRGCVGFGVWVLWLLRAESVPTPLPLLDFATEARL